MSVYCELLACYLASQPPELAQAKFLMQRVPLSVQEAEEGQELARLWRIGRSMWTQNTAEVYSNLAGPWSEPVQRIMDKVRYKIQVNKALICYVVNNFSSRIP